MDKTYQIIWADDEIDALLDDTSKALLAKQHVEVIKCNNAAMLEEKLRNVNYRIDAVIVDANFTARDFTPSDESIVSGLRKAMRLMGEYKHLPFYLFTQRANLSDLVEEDELSYFNDNNAFFLKSDGLLPLLERIKKDVDKINSAAFQIDNQFKKELYYFQMFDKQCHSKSYNTIREMLIRSREGVLTRTEDYFNPFRKIIENMKNVSAHFGIVPEGLSLNHFSLFICSNNNDYELNEELLPKALHMLMQYVVRMVQDGSHTDSGLKYEVSKFVSERQDILIIQSLLFAIIELISWFIPYLATHIFKEYYLANWYKV